MQQTVDHPLRSSTGFRLSAYVAVLALVFGGAAAVGAAIGPEPSDDTATTAEHGGGAHSTQTVTVGEVEVSVAGHLVVGEPSTLDVTVGGSHDDGGHAAVDQVDQVDQVVVVGPDGAAVVARPDAEVPGRYVVEPLVAGPHRVYVDVEADGEVLTAAVTLEATP